MRFFSKLLLLNLCLAPGWAAQKDYALILSDPPLSEGAVSRHHLDSVRAGRIGSTQARVRSELARRQVRALGSVQTLLNAIFVRANDSQAAALKEIPGVKKVA